MEALGGLGPYPEVLLLQFLIWPHHDDFLSIFVLFQKHDGEGHVDVRLAFTWWDHSHLVLLAPFLSGKGRVLAQNKCDS